MLEPQVRLFSDGRTTAEPPCPHTFTNITAARTFLPYSPFQESWGRPLKFRGGKWHKYPQFRRSTDLFSDPNHSFSRTIFIPPAPLGRLPQVCGPSGHVKSGADLVMMRIQIQEPASSILHWLPDNHKQNNLLDYHRKTLEIQKSP